MARHVLLLNEAIVFFVKCQRPEKCLQHYMLMKEFYIGEEENMVTLTRGCILKMYHTQNFKISSLKALLWNELPDKTNPAHYTVTEMIEKWETNVGSIDSTLHWVKEELHYHIYCMNKMSLDMLQCEFSEQRTLDKLATGVMDVLFISACFKLPSVDAMGPLFWIFARELIQLHLASVDQLNSLLWGLVLPQTVIVLEPKKYALDSLLDPIIVPLTIQGQQTDQGVTTVEVSSQTSLVFFNNARLDKIRFVQTLPVSMPPTEFIVKFSGYGGCKLVASMTDVEFVRAGFSVQFYNRMQCNHVFVSRAVIGIHARNVEQLSILGYGSNEMCDSPTGFDACALGMQFMDVDLLLIENQAFSGTEKIFHACVKTSCIVRNCSADNCPNLGTILMAGHATPVFVDFEVDSEVKDLELGVEACSELCRIIYTAREPNWSVTSD